jgi:hypothetical protein
MPRIVIPDDYPVVMGSSPSFLKWRERMSSVPFDTLPGSEEGLVSRIADAEVVINIRSSRRMRSMRMRSIPCPVGVCGGLFREAPGRVVAAISAWSVGTPARGR